MNNPAKSLIVMLALSSLGACGYSSKHMVEVHPSTYQMFYGKLASQSTKAAAARKSDVSSELVTQSRAFRPAPAARATKAVATRVGQDPCGAVKYAHLVGKHPREASILPLRADSRYFGAEETPGPATDPSRFNLMIDRADIVSGMLKTNTRIAKVFCG